MVHTQSKIIKIILDSKSLVDDDGNIVKKIGSGILFAHVGSGIIAYDVMRFDAISGLGFSDLINRIDYLLNDIADSIDINDNGFSLIEHDNIEGFSHFECSERGLVTIDFTIKIDNFLIDSIYIHPIMDDYQYDFKIPFELIPTTYEKFQAKINIRISEKGYR